MTFEKIERLFSQRGEGLGTLLYWLCVGWWTAAIMMIVRAYVRLWRVYPGTACVVSLGVVLITLVAFR